MRKFMIAAAFVAAILLGSSSASASSIAVFGDNEIDNFLSINGHTVSLVTDAQLATPGFLSGFDVFFFTRDGDSFGTGLSAAAAANVSTFVTGNAVAFLGDFADSFDAIQDDGPLVQQMLLQAVAFAAANGGGFVGEFNGAVSALQANAEGFTPLGIFAGSAGPLGFGTGGSTGLLFADAFNGGHPVLAGIGAFPFNPISVEYGALIAGANPAEVIARFESATGGNAAILARTAAVPEPTTLVLLGSGLLAAARARRRR